MTKKHGKCKCFMDKHELALKAAKAKPHVRYAYDADSDTIGAFDSSVQRFVCVAGKLLSGQWVSMEHELLINGQPITRNWIEVTNE